MDRQFLALLLTACSAEVPPPLAPADAGEADASAADAEVLQKDAAESDASEADATPIEDAGAIDAVPIDTGLAGDPYPDPAAWGPNTGPGGPATTFPPDALYQTCTHLDGGPDDITDHHNLVTMFDGYLLMPWAPEFRRGGLTFFDVSDPCAPVVAGSGYSEEMRESHSIGFSSINGS